MSEFFDQDGDAMDEAEGIQHGPYQYDIIYPDELCVGYVEAINEALILGYITPQEHGHAMANLAEWQQSDLMAVLARAALEEKQEDEREGTPDVDLDPFDVYDDEPLYYDEDSDTFEPNEGDPEPTATWEMTQVSDPSDLTAIAFAKLGQLIVPFSVEYDGIE
jgi:hypothetical protein